MYELDFPEKYSFQIKEEDNLPYIFDEIRKKYILLTPEEWVRQHLIHFLRKKFKLPNSSFIIEKKIVLNEQTKRLDILLINKGNPFILVECKAPDIKIDKSTFEQAARYNIQINAKYILLSNGLQHLYFELDKKVGNYKVINDIKF